MRFKLGSSQQGFGASMRDLDILTDKFINDEVMCRLIYYTSEDALQKPILGAEQKVEMIQKEQITAVPRLKVSEDNEISNYVLLGFANFAPTSNPEFMDAILTIDIVCHVDNWKVYEKSGKLHYRPYALAELIHNHINGKKMTGIGYPTFLEAEPMILTTNPDFAGISLKYVCTNFAPSKD